MTLFETATELQLRLESATAADTGDQLLSRGRTVRADIASAAEHFEAVQSYRITIGRTDRPPLAAKEIRQAIGRFRGTLSNSGPKAVQQRSAVTLLKVLDTQIKRVDRWVKSTWQENFAASQELLERADSGDLHGSPVNRIRALNRARRVMVLRNTDPVRERAALQELLKVKGLKACLEKANELIDDLRDAIAAIDREQAAMTPQVRAVLQRAASGDGLPLGEVTPELLVALQSGGVLDDLVVRRL